LARPASTARRRLVASSALALVMAVPACGNTSPLDAVSAATIRITSTGTFESPEAGQQLNQAGSGSGFIIDPSGIAITNNHVVTGAATLEVHVPGEDRPRNARVLGASECSDLAVIDIEGDGFPVLWFATEEATAGLDVLAAGYPLGAPEFTVTRGIVSKASTSGETTWASVDGVLEHDATINPGNSGGPLVTERGRVIGVNYAGDSATNQYLAITAAGAQDLIAKLRAGTDVDSIGVNGQAMVVEGSFSGIWVASVKSGSPADEAGIQAGDVITKLENLVLATDGTMREYCDVIRSHDAGGVLAVEVLRSGTGEVLEGQLGGRPLAPTTSFVQEVASEAPAGQAAAASAASYGQYTQITDDTAAIRVDVPAEWSEVDGAPYTGPDGIRRVDVRAAPNLAAFRGAWDTPGMIFTASSELARSSNEIALLDEVQPALMQHCTYEGRQPYQDPVYTGSYDVYGNCGGVGAKYIVIGAVPPAREFVMRVQVQVNGERDLEALDRIINTFQVIGDV
jgi:serine protease Do